MTVDFTLFIRRARNSCWLVLLGMVCFGSAASRVWATQSVELSWIPSPTDDVVAYNVYVGTQIGDYTICINDADVSELLTNDVEVCAAIIPGLEDGTTYYFEVTSVDASGNESERSNEAAYAVPTSGLLALQVQATMAAFQTVQVAWTPSPESDVYGYVVSYGTQSGVYTSSVEFDYATNGMISGLVGGATNYFVVSPIDDYGVEAAASSVVPTPVCVLNAQVATNSPGVSLSWNDLTDEGAVGYNVAYGIQSSNYSQTLYCDSVTNAVVNGLEGGQTYYFAVAAVDAYGNESPFSTEASAVAPMPAPALLQSQTYTDDTGQPYGMEINTFSCVSGPWEMDSSTNLQDWTYYTSGYGSGNGDGYDVYAWVSVDPTGPQVFFRVVQATYEATVTPTIALTEPAPIALQSQTYTDTNGQPHFVITTSSSVSDFWEIDVSTNLQNWTYYTSAENHGNGEDDDLNVDVPIDPTAPQMFFRAVNY